MTRRLSPTLAVLALASTSACPGVEPAVDQGGNNGISTKAPDPDPDAPAQDKLQPPVAAEKAPGPSPRLSNFPQSGALTPLIGGYFERQPGSRIYIQVDKPLYRPGETIWIKTWDLGSKDLGARANNNAIRYELVSPKGATVLQKNVQEEKGTASNDFEIPDSVQGGEYLIRATSFDGVTAERPVVVSTYEAPRLKKKMEFVKKAYGAGDEVTATIKVERATGEALPRHPLNAVIWLDGQTLAPAQATTNESGGAIIRFRLPERVERGDGLLTVMIEDGGITESIARRIPILVKKLDFAFFPEGGQLLSGTPSRIYFEAKNPIGKPADVEGKIVDDHGNVAATFATHHAGLGRIELIPNTGRRYFAQITRPAGITEQYALPVALESGCTLRSYDDLDGSLPELRVAVRCSEAKKVVVVAMVRERLLDEAYVDVPANEAAVVYLKSADEALAKAQGVARVTVFDENKQPLAERLVYRNRRNRLNVELTADKPEYSPREQVALSVKTTDAQGNPVPAELALSVVDDTVLSFADDKTGHLLTRLYLESELSDKVEEPNFFFDLTKEKSALAMDLLMGTKGYRRFEWQQVFMPPVPASSGPGRPADALGAIMDDEGDGAPRGGRGRPAPAARPAPPMNQPKGQVLPPAPAKAPAPPAAEPVVQAGEKKKLAEAPAEMAKEARRAPARQEVQARIAKPDMDRGDFAKDEAWAEAEEEKIAMPQFVPVRVFPAPTYRGDETGPRTDFRETIHWAPTVFTGKDGRATVTFYLSDAVTSFRAIAEGVGSGAGGRVEKIVKSSLPFSLSVKLPLEVTAGDLFLLPITLSNEKDKPVEVALEVSFGDKVELQKGGATVTEGDALLSVDTGLKTTLGPKERKSVYYPLAATTKSGKSKIQVFANASGLKDEYIRELEVVPLGFPHQESVSGTLKDVAKHQIDLGEALPGTAQLTVKLYPSPVASLISGLEGMLREPSGCFEQTSSSNYPNIMVLDYLRAHDVADPDLIQRTNGLLERGYQKLVGYETPNKGYEWFGQSPPHEALSAYGVLEFVDMKRVYGEVDEVMIGRTQSWLKSRRDGKGGFLRDPKALDSFGGAKPEVTNAYIIYALTEAGTYDIEEEIAGQAAVATTTDDAYLLALASNTLLNVPARKAEGQKAAARLAKMQDKDGRFAGKDHSITRSTGINLDIETTALAVLALLKTTGYDEQLRAAVQWLGNNRSGYGQWGATQATVLALKAMTTYANATRKTPAPGVVTLKINGQVINTLSYEAGRRDPLILTASAEVFTSGMNTIELVHDGKSELPYSAAIELRSKKPASDPNAVVELRTELAESKIKMGASVRLTATIKNRTQNGQPMTLARIGLPGGLTFQTWQLKELKEKGLVAFTETRAREVIIYFRDLGPGEEKVVPLDLVALVPGTYEGPASSAYLYYSDDSKTWIDGTKVVVSR